MYIVPLDAGHCGPADALAEAEADDDTEVDGGTEADEDTCELIVTLDEDVGYSFGGPSEEDVDVDFDDLVELVEDRGPVYDDDEIVLVVPPIPILIVFVLDEGRTDERLVE